jgi:hypothetical protein
MQLRDNALFPRGPCRNSPRRRVFGDIVPLDTLRLFHRVPQLRRLVDGFGNVALPEGGSAVSAQPGKEERIRQCRTVQCA